MNRVETDSKTDEGQRQIKDKFEFSKNQMELIFNSLDMPIYFCDMISHEILFMNDHLKNLYNNDFTGQICWESFHSGMDGPCNFCSNDKLFDSDGAPAEDYKWEFNNTKLKKWFVLYDRAIPWLDGRFVRMEIATDITDLKQSELEQKKTNKYLENLVRKRTNDLQEMNSALKILIKSGKNDKLEVEEKILKNYKLRILPIIDKLKNSLTQTAHQDLIKMLDSELDDIISPFSRRLSQPLLGLTPAEIGVAALIRYGKTNKEISEFLNRSIHTISRHRENIRKKLNLKNKKINLRSYLSTLQ